MSDEIKHECGIAMIRLLKPLEYYQFKYGSWRYAINKLYLLMEKQHNRGQDGAGVACVKFDMPPGHIYIDRHRSAEPSSIDDVFKKIHKHFKNIKPGLLDDPIWAKANLPFAGELFLGHLRYGTFGENNIDYVHPVMRLNNWKTRNLALAGNFNLTNVDDIFQHLIDLGQHPKDFSDTVTVLENVGHFLDDEVQDKFDQYKEMGYENIRITELTAENLDVKSILIESCKRWDGGFVIAGLIGHGDALPSGIPGESDLLIITRMMKL